MRLVYLTVVIVAVFFMNKNLRVSAEILCQQQEQQQEQKQRQEDEENKQLPGEDKRQEQDVGVAGDPNNAHYCERMDDALIRFEVQFNRTVENHRLPGWSYGLSLNSSVITHRWGGWADLEQDVPMASNSKFRVSSITKTFTALAIGQLVDSGRLHYNNSIWRHLDASTDLPHKQYHSQTVDITIGQLLTHTSGMGAFDDELDLWTINQPKNCSEAIRKLQHRPLHSKPGLTFEFSHSGFQILGAILEKIHNRTFSELFHEFVHDTLKLEDTVLESQDRIIPLKVKNYRQQSYVLEDQPDFKMVKNVPAGVRDDVLLTQGYWPAMGAVSTILDILKYGEILLDIYHFDSKRTILTEASLKQMWSRQTPANSSMNFGYGWAITELNRADYPDAHLLTCVWHDGQLDGSSAILQIYPEQRIVAAAFTNVGSITWLDLMMINLSELVYAATL